MGFLKDEEKQQLLDRYFDIEWCDYVSDLRCVRCHRVAISHCVSSCQHIFCNNCSKLYNNGQQLQCPRCQEFIKQPDDKDFDVEVKIHQLKIFCPNKKYGCKHEDQIRKILTHLLTCGNTREAAHQVESPVVISSTSFKEVTEEFREKMREFNQVEAKCNQMESKNDDNDKKLNALAERITSLEKKVEDASLGIESASKKHLEELKSMTSMIASINQTIEQSESFFLQKMSCYMENMRIMKDSMIQEMEALQKQKPEELHHMKAEYYEWTMKYVMNSTADDSWKLESEAFRFTGHNYEIRAKLRKKDGMLDIFLQFKDGDTINQLINKHVFTSVKYIVSDQSNSRTKKDITVEADLRFDESFGCYDWIFRKALPMAILSPPYTTNDRIKINILFEPPSLDDSFVSNNGVLNWRVDNYKTIMKEQTYCDVWSPFFYTSPQGYRVKIRLIIVRSEPMDVMVYFLTGKHDANLIPKFPHKTTVTLFNQVDPSKNLIKRKQMNYVKCYTVQFEKSRISELNDFIKDDSLIFKVVIEPVIL